jgi:2-keto-3-deoxy-galactonokinase
MQRELFQIRKGESASREARDVVQLVLESSDPVIKKALDLGLPAGASAFTHRTVRCDECGAKIRMVPCVGCYMIDKWTEPGEESDDIGYVALEPKRPTSKLPGTKAKQRIQQRRVSRGESPFHQDDEPSRPAVEIVTAREIRFADLIAAARDRSY